MRHRDLPHELVGLITPAALRSYAEDLGWTRVDGINGTMTVYSNPANELQQLLVPSSQHFDDYARRTAD